MKPTQVQATPPRYHRSPYNAQQTMHLFLRSDSSLFRDVDTCIINKTISFPYLYN